MTEEKSVLNELIANARSSRGGLGELLERYRPFLLLMAQRRIGLRLAVRCAPEDVVQQTYVEAQQAFPSFRGATAAEFSAWIQRIHSHNLTEMVRKHTAAGRQNLKAEERLERLDPVDGTISFCWLEPAADQTSPSQRVVKDEKALRLAALLQTLPEMQREAIRLRYLEGWPVEKIAQELDRSVAATAGLLKRGLQALRAKMSEGSWQ